MGITLSKNAAKVLRALNEPTYSRIKDAIFNLPLGDVIRMQGEPGHYRLRVGGFRVIFRYDKAQDEIYVTKIAPRGQAYKGGMGP